MVQTSLGTVVIKYTHISLTIYKTVVNVHYLIGLCLAPAGSLMACLSYSLLTFLDANNILVCPMYRIMFHNIRHAMSKTGFSVTNRSRKQRSDFIELLLKSSNMIRCNLTWKSKWELYIYLQGTLCYPKYFELNY